MAWLGRRGPSRGVSESCLPMTVWFRGRLLLLSMSSALSRLLSGGNVVRYADDFVITGRTRELLEREIRPLVEQFLRERGLELSLDKTVITHIKDGSDFLGQNVRKCRNRTLLLTPLERAFACSWRVSVELFGTRSRLWLVEKLLLTKFAKIKRVRMRYQRSSRLG